MTAVAARREANSATTTALLSDHTEYALCAGDPEQLRSLMSQVYDAKSAGTPKGTAAADTWGFSWAVTFGQATKTRWMTPRVGSPDINPVTERWRAALYLFWTCQHMKASARRQKQGFKEAKPTSPLLALYGYRRVLRDCDRYLADLDQVRAVLRGICALYKQVYGPEAFAVHQAKIFSRAMLLKIAESCVACIVTTWTATRHAAWKVIHAFEVGTGTRKDEFTKAFPADDCIMRANFVWIDGEGNELSMTVTVIASRIRGNLLRGKSAPSKCDRLNLEWSKQLQWFRLDEDDPLNFAYAFQQWELAHPCPLHERGNWPAFSPTGDMHPFSPSAAAHDHQQLLSASIGAIDAADRTIHSYRASLVSAMYVAKAKGNHEFTEGVMQAHVRHKTLDAMYGYGKMTPSNFADNIAKLTTMDPSLAKREDLPEHEPAATLQAVEAILEDMGGSSSSGAAPATAAPSAARGARAAAAAAGGAVPAAPLANAFVTVVGCPEPVRDLGTDSWHLVGCPIELPNDLWGEGGGTTMCTITHFIGKHEFPGPPAKVQVAYTVAIDGDDDHYAVRASTVARHIEPIKRKALRKKALPKPLTA